MGRNGKLVAGAFVYVLLAPGLVRAENDAELRGLENVKQFTVEHSRALSAQAGLLEQTLSTYAETIEAHKGDYAAAWAANGPELSRQVANVRDLWLETSNRYETIEGIVAGIPEMAEFDLILDAGNPGTESEDVAEYDLTLPDGTVLPRPGNLFHGITEPLFWGMSESGIRLPADLDGDGKIVRGEMLFDANLGLGAARALAFWAAALEADMTSWKPNRADAFTSVAVMTPTVGDYFGEWKESQFISGEIGAFVARSRLVDVIGIMSGCRKMYAEAISPVVAASDGDLDSRITASFEELLGLVEDTYAREQAGAEFGVEEADALGNDAQDIADRIVAMVLQAAAKNGVEIRG